jgi:hypothetical protein
LIFGGFCTSATANASATSDNDFYHDNGMQERLQVISW